MTWPLFEDNYAVSQCVHLEWIISRRQQFTRRHWTESITHHRFRCKWKSIADCELCKLEYWMAPGSHFNNDGHHMFNYRGCITYKSGINLVAVAIYQLVFARNFSNNLTFLCHRQKHRLRTQASYCIATFSSSSTGRSKCQNAKLGAATSEQPNRNWHNLN